MDWTAVGAIGQILAAVATYMTIAQMREERHEAVLPVLDVVDVRLTNELDERGRLRFNPDKADCSLNVRVRNNGLGVARNVKLGSRCDRKPEKAGVAAIHPKEEAGIGASVHLTESVNLVLCWQDLYGRRFATHFRLRKTNTNVQLWQTCRGRQVLIWENPYKTG